MSSCIASFQCSVLAAVALYGCGHWDYWLLWNTNDGSLSALPLLPPSLHKTLPLCCVHCHLMLISHSIFLSNPIILSPISPISGPSLRQKHSHDHRAHTRITHTLRLPSPSRTCSLFHSLAHPVVFFNGSFCPFHLRGNKGFLCPLDGGKQGDTEPDREEEIHLTLSAVVQKYSYINKADTEIDSNILQLRGSPFNIFSYSTLKISVSHYKCGMTQKVLSRAPCHILLSH